MRGQVKVEVDNLVYGSKHVFLGFFVLIVVQDVPFLPHHLFELARVVFGDVKLRRVHQRHCQRQIQEVKALVRAKTLQYLVLSEFLVKVRIVEEIHVVRLHHPKVELVGLNQILDCQVYF